MTISSEQYAAFKIDNACPNIVDTTFLRYYNDARDVVIDRIVQEKEDFFYNELTVDTYAGKREYVLPKRGDLAEDGVTVLDGVKKLKAIGVKFSSTDVEYSKLPPHNTDLLDNDLLYYSGTNNVSPFYILSDTSVFLYPTPTESVDAGMILYAIMQPKKLALTDSETLSDSISKVILLGVAQRWFTSQKQYDYAAANQAAFEKELSRVAVNLSGRIQSPKQVTLPSVKQFK